MARLLLIRHAPTAWTAEHRIQGRTDTPLSPDGRAAAAGFALPESFRDCNVVLVSPLRRARETAALMGLAHAWPDPALIERAWGAWEGWRTADLKRHYDPATVDADRAGLDARPPGGGESPRDQQTRLAPRLAELAASGGDAVAITHKGVIRALYALATGWDMTCDPPDKLRDGHGHAFELGPGGAPRVAALNLALRREPA